MYTPISIRNRVRLIRDVFVGPVTAQSVPTYQVGTEFVVNQIFETGEFVPLFEANGRVSTIVPVEILWGLTQDPVIQVKDVRNIDVEIVD